MIGLLLACSAGTVNQGMPAGQWALEGEEYTGSLHVEEDACEIELWGPALQAGPGRVPCQTVREEEVFGVHFGIQMGVGEAMAYAEVSRDLSGFTLPLGSRSGDFEHRLRMRSGELSQDAREAAQKNTASGLANSRRMWAKSVFQLHHDGELVGELFFPSDRAPEIQLYSPLWMTRGRVTTTLMERGPDLWLSFEIMPSLQSEEGLALVNRAENHVVFPLGDTPVPGEIVLDLAEGSVTEEQRGQSLKEALEEGLAVERSVTQPVVEALWAKLMSSGCREWSGLSAESPALGVALQGYSVDIRGSSENCRLQVEPRPVQQGRRLAFRVEMDAPIEVVERKFFPEVPRNF